MQPIALLVSLLLPACLSKLDSGVQDSDTPEETGLLPVDADGDGALSSEDCDDDDPAAHPGADEICDGRDNDCDGTTDEGVLLTWHADADADGWGTAAHSTQACTAPTGSVADGTDCDDGDADIHPGASERCDLVDNDCDGTIDEDVVVLWYADADGDGYGDASISTASCDPDTGWVAGGDDCADDDFTIHPGATEVCDGRDQDCDGFTDDDASDAPTWYADSDLDGYGDASSPTRACEAPSGCVPDGSDCDDTSRSVHPGATEYCDGEDNDCDGTADGSAAVDATTWYADADRDGCGDISSTSRACDVPAGFVATATDCDDTNAYVHPFAEETCNGRDDDCDWETDESDATDAATWYADGDGDGWGDATFPVVACTPPDGTSPTAGDCDDRTPTTWPGATEVCNDVDDDCDEVTDEPDAADAPTWYEDHDGDGHGNYSVSEVACEAPDGYVPDSLDCDDLRSAVHPDAGEYCNAMDDDCDGYVDEDDSVDAPTWYADADGDGFGSLAAARSACRMPSGTVTDSTDCDDTHGGNHPGATEVCDEQDNDCDGTSDEADAIDAAIWYADTDGDTYGNPLVATRGCTLPPGFVLASDTAVDCDDASADTRPGAPEVCDHLDNDCDSATDEPDAVDVLTWYLDADGDGYGVDSRVDRACECPEGYSPIVGDCNDDDGTVSPDAEEICNDHVDNDCDGTARPCALMGDLDLGYADARLLGEARDDVSGNRIASADTDGDGQDDILVAAEHNGGSDQGAIYLVRGPITGSVALSLADAKVQGAYPSDRFGSGVAGGDLDGDGLDDLLGGAWFEDSGGTSAGAVYVMLSPATGTVDASSADAWFMGEQSGDQAGTYLASGDLDGDGLDEVLVGAYEEDSGGSNSGAAYIVGLPATSPWDLSLAETKLIGENPGDSAGIRVATGDLDGDGIDDALVSAYLEDSGGTDAGAVYAVLGPRPGSLDLSLADARIIGEAADDRAGISVASCDMDGDGLSDLVVGAYHNDAGGSDSGAAFLVLSPLPSTLSLGMADARLVGELANDYAGISVATGDVDADGVRDMVVGAHYQDTNGSATGTTYLVTGPVSGTFDLSLAEARFLGEQVEDYSGVAVTTGDFDGNAVSDILIGAYYQDAAATNSGTTYLVYGGGL